MRRMSKKAAVTVAKPDSPTSIPSPPGTVLNGVYIGDLLATDSEEELGQLVHEPSEGSKAVWKWAKGVDAAENRRKLVSFHFCSV